MRHATALSLFLLAAVPVNAAPGDEAALAEAERGFAALSVRTDMKTAFLANFAADGVLVSDGWQTAVAAFGDGPAPPTILDWGPSHVEVARSGELGLSTGPWIRKQRAKPDAPPAHGHFVSIWRKSADGMWKVEVDLGIAHPEDIAIPAKASSPPPEALPAAGGTLAEAEARFDEASRKRGARAAYEAHALPRFMLYRAGHAPYRGKSEALAARELSDAPTAWLVDARGVAASNDFGYVRGRYAEAADPSRTRGYFLRVWRRDATGWGIVLDVTAAAR